MNKKLLTYKNHFIMAALQLHNNTAFQKYQVVFLNKRKLFSICNTKKRWQP